MLMITGRTLLASASAAALAVVSGAALAAGLTSATALSAAPAGPQGGPTVNVNHGGDCGERNCDVEWERPPAPPGVSNPAPVDNRPRCFFDNGDGTISVADRSGGQPGFVLVAAQVGRVEVPCYMDGFGWYLDGCYYGETPSPAEGPDRPPAGKTDEDGRWYYETCLIRVDGELPNQSYTTFANLRWRWFDIDEVPEITPGDVAQRWVARIGLDGVVFQLSPPPIGAGLVGLPVWLGVAQTPNTLGPISDTSCIGDVCVQISARVSTIEWDMGDGNVFTCTADQHVVWQPGMEFSNPGNRCHHIYQRSSRGQPDQQFTITATSTWAVSWNTPVESGTLAPTRTAQTSLRIDEIQVLTSQ